MQSECFLEAKANCLIPHRIPRFLPSPPHFIYIKGWEPGVQQCCYTIPAYCLSSILIVRRPSASRRLDIDRSCIVAVGMAFGVADV